MEYITDGKKILVCKPYNKNSMLSMSIFLRLKPKHYCKDDTFIFGYYKIPKKRKEEFNSLSTVLEEEKIVKIIKESIEHYVTQK